VITFSFSRFLILTLPKEVKAVSEDEKKADKIKQNTKTTEYKAMFIIRLSYTSLLSSYFSLPMGFKPVYSEVYAGNPTLAEG
jgi:hypothetical protein